MKVVFLQNIDGIAGSERYFLAIIPALIKKGIDVEMCCVVKKSETNAADPFIALLKAQKIPHSIISCLTYASPAIPFRINKRLKETKADIVHAHLIYADVWLAIIKRFLNKHVSAISTKHGYHETTYVKHCLSPDKTPHNLYYYLFKFSHQQMDASYACSFGLVEFYTSAGLIKADEMQVIHHGFDYPEIENGSEELYRFSKNQLIITGRLIERKGHHFILEIMPSLISRFPDLVLVVLGTGVLEEKLKLQVKDIDLIEHVKFMGFQADVAKFLAHSDLMLVTSYSEGLPLVIFEAFNAKTPVITFDTIGSNELVENHKTGIVVPAFDTEKLAEGIAALLKDKQKSALYAAQAYQALHTNHSLNHMVESTIDFYQRHVL